MALRLLSPLSVVSLSQTDCAEFVMSSVDDEKRCRGYAIGFERLDDERDERRGERRADLRHVIRSLAANILTRHDDRALPTVLEQALAQIVPARTVRLREVPARYPSRLAAPARTSESVVLDVPTPDSERQFVLEAIVDPDRPLDEWNVDLLSTATFLGTLVLEMEGRRNPAPVPFRLDGAAPLIGSTPAMRALRERIERVAGTDFMTLIEGESGTGKELVARLIHELSWRRRGPFVALNCAALVESLLEAELFGIEDRTATGVKGRRGKFELADRGTLFLDEVSDLSFAAQAKLLRTIEDLMVERVGGNAPRRVDVRIVAATNRPLSGLVAKGLFRADLFYRLSGVEVHVPTLRSRPDDILELARYFLARYRPSRELTLSAAATDVLQIYPWPGNVRELERMVERTVALATGSRIEVDDLPPQVRGSYTDVFSPSVDANESMRAWGSRYARLIYERHGRNKRKACQALGISYHTLDAYLRYAQGTFEGGRKNMPAWVTASMPTEGRPTDARREEQDGGLEVRQA
jgi:transcriptional regulator with PAS, ATPase and Fis domain